MDTIAALPSSKVLGVQYNVDGLITSNSYYVIKDCVWYVYNIYNIYIQWNVTVPKNYRRINIAHKQQLLFKVKELWYLEQN